MSENFLTPETTFREALESAKSFGANMLKQTYRDAQTDEVALLFLVARGSTAEVIERFTEDMNPSEEELQEEDRQLAAVEAVMAQLPVEQRRVIEKYFGFISEASIQEEIAKAMKEQGCSTLEEYEAGLSGISAGVTPRSMAMASILGR